jgi:hypothetical protein
MPHGLPDPGSKVTAVASDAGVNVSEKSGPTENSPKSNDG